MNKAFGKASWEEDDELLFSAGAGAASSSKVCGGGLEEGDSDDDINVDDLVGGPAGDELAIFIGATLCGPHVSKNSMHYCLALG